MRTVMLITGLMAAGKTTLGPQLAVRLSAAAAAFDGDTLYRMMVSGNVDMTPKRDPEAVRQVQLRYDAAALLAQHYADAGFDFIYTDMVFGADVSRWFAKIKGARLHLVVLDPSAEAIMSRAAGRNKGTTYHEWQQPGMTMADAIGSIREWLLQTPRRGLWLDTSSLSEQETVDAILADDLRASRY